MYWILILTFWFMCGFLAHDWYIYIYSNRWANHVISNQERIDAAVLFVLGPIGFLIIKSVFYSTKMGWHGKDIW